MGLRRSLSGLLIMAAALLLASCDLGGVATATPTPVPANTPNLPPPGGMEMPSTYTIRDDLDYIDMMVPHHQLAIEMSKIALERAQHGEITGIARDIIKEQQDEVRRMEIWRTAFYPAAPTPDPTTTAQGTMGMNVDLGKLRSASEFDREFIAEMIPHHQAAIEMSQAALSSDALKHQEVHDFANDVINFQQLEIDRMLLWQQQWFP